jgi:hypothetical protein
MPRFDPRIIVILTALAAVLAIAGLLTAKW